MSLTGGNRNDVTQLLPLLDKIPAVAGRVGRPRRRPDALLADRGYDHNKHRRLPWQRGIRPVIAKRGQPHGTSLGIFRYVVERTIAWLHGFRRLRIRWERRGDTHEAFLGHPSARDPGRRAGSGAGAGSMVNHSLFVATANPLEHRLLFERFLSERRTSLPDIDLDVESERRLEVYDAIIERFGKERTAVTGMPETYRARHALRFPVKFSMLSSSRAA